MNRSRFCVIAVPASHSRSRAGPAAASADGPSGRETFTEGAQCTSNFVFTDGGEHVPRARRPTAPAPERRPRPTAATRGSLPLGTPVEIDGATQPGTLVYNSWIAMQNAGETERRHLRVQRLRAGQASAADAASVNPTVPAFGGPEGLGPSEAELGDTVYSYGNSSLRQGVTKLSPKQGVVVESAGNGWSRTVYTLTPGVPGDSGSGFMNESGQAIGTLSTLAIAPVPASNGVGRPAQGAELPEQLGRSLQRQPGQGQQALQPGSRQRHPRRLEHL